VDSPISIRSALLQALIRGEGYGLELIERVATLTNNRLSLSPGRAYPVLRELEAEGFATSSKSEPLPERGGRARIVYRITAEGRRAAREDCQTVWGLFTPAPAGG
jgi:DNA-binding PadR family transcriptional regulator